MLMFTESNFDIERTHDDNGLCTITIVGLLSTTEGDDGEVREPIVSFHKTPSSSVWQMTHKISTWYDISYISSINKLISVCLNIIENEDVILRRNLVLESVDPKRSNAIILLDGKYVDGVGDDVFICLSDYGNIMKLTESEIKESFKVTNHGDDILTHKNYCFTTLEAMMLYCLVTDKNTTVETFTAKEYTLPITKECMIEQINGYINKSVSGKIFDIGFVGTEIFFVGDKDAVSELYSLYNNRFLESTTTSPHTRISPNIKDGLDAFCVSNINLEPCRSNYRFEFIESE